MARMIGAIRLWLRIVFWPWLVYLEGR